MFYKHRTIAAQCIFLLLSIFSQVPAGQPNNTRYLRQMVNTNGGAGNPLLITIK